MWCYQKPGFKALLVAELQRQQESSQFCDVLLNAKGASVSAHSCVLSVVSPFLSSSLSSLPPSPAGTRQQVEFQDLDARTLLHMVDLLYSGEMAGEGEWEKQEAISMAARLGIDGLVEVTSSDGKQRPQGEVGHCTEVAVQTCASEVAVQTSAMGMEVAVQTSAMGMEVAVQTSAMGLEVAVQTCAAEVEVQTSAMGMEVAVQTSAMGMEVAVQTSAMGMEVAVQTEREGGCTRWRREVRDGVTLLWKEPESSGGQDTWTQTEELPIMTAPPPPLPPLHSAASYQTIDINTLQSLGQTDSQLVPISIVYNENQWAQASSTSSAPSVPLEESTVVRTECVGTSTPFSLYSGHVGPYGAVPHAGLTALQASEDIDHEHFEQFQGNIPGFISHFLNPEMEEASRGRRAGRKRGAAAGRARRAGTTGRRPRGRGRGALTQTVDVQEVSAAGRLQMLYLHRSGGRRRRRSGQGGGAAGRKLQLKSREMLNSGTAQQKRRVCRKVWQLDQTGDLQLCSGGGGGRGSGQRGMKNAAPQAGCSASRTPRSRNQLSSPYDVSTLPAPGAALHCSASAAAPFLSPAASLLHTCSLPPTASLPHDEQPEHIDRLLEEVMMGLDIIPKSSDAARPPPASSSSFTQNQPQCPASDRRGPPQEAGGAAGPRPANGEVCVLQQVCEGGVNKILDQFLQSYEQFINNEERQTAGERGAEAAKPHTALSKYKRSLSPRVQNAGAPQQLRRPRAPKEKSGQSLPSSSQPHGAMNPKPSRPQARQRPKQLPLSLEKKRVKLKMAVTIHDLNIDVNSRAEKQLQQIPVVRLRRSQFLPVSVMLRDLKAEDPLRMELSPRGKNSNDLLPEEYLQLFADRKIYPIRSRLKTKSCNECCSIIDKPFHVLEEPPRSHHRAGRSNNTDKELKINQGSNVQPQKESVKSRRRPKKRRKSSQGPGEGVRATKKVCLALAVQPSRGDQRATSESQPEEFREVKTSPLSAAGRSQEEEEHQRGTERRLIEVAGRGENESQPPDSRTSPPRTFHSQPRVSPWRPAPEQDEDVDVIGGSSPAPNPVTISWTDCSEEEEQEEEDVDVVGEK